MPNPFTLKNSSVAELLVFFSITYGVCWGIGIANFFHPVMSGYIFAIFMMLLPATGVSVGKLCRNTGHAPNKSIHVLYIVHSSVFLCFILLKAGSIISENAFQAVSLSLLPVISSVLCLLFSFLGEGNLSPVSNWHAIKWDLALFLLLLFTFVCVGCLDAEKMDFTVVPNLLFSAPIFFMESVLFIGEEYGWRGFLQEKFQNKFGKRRGVLLLGILWEVWHLPFLLNLFQTDVGSVALRLFSTTSLAVVIGYVYMKSRNVWICAFMHFIFNFAYLSIPGNTVPFSGKIDFTTVQLLKTPATLFAMILMITAFYSFLFAKEYRKTDDAPHCVRQPKTESCNRR